MTSNQIKERDELQRGENINFTKKCKALQSHTINYMYRQPSVIPTCWSKRPKPMSVHASIRKDRGEARQQRQITCKPLRTELNSYEIGSPLQAPPLRFLYDALTSFTDERYRLSPSCQNTHLTWVSATAPHGVSATASPMPSSGTVPTLILSTW